MESVGPIVARLSQPTPSHVVIYQALFVDKFTWWHRCLPAGCAECFSFNWLYVALTDAIQILTDMVMERGVAAEWLG